MSCMQLRRVVEIFEASINSHASTSNMLYTSTPIANLYRAHANVPFVFDVFLGVLSRCDGSFAGPTIKRKSTFLQDKVI
jgi:hypothetical protein